MIINYIKSALRNMRRYKVYTLINIVGLTLGLAASLALFAYVAEDLGWDGFHEKKDRIFLLTQKESYAGADMEFTSMIVPPLAPALADEIPEVEATARFGIRDRLVIAQGDLEIDERHCCFADPAFLKMFSFPLIYGDPETALNRPDAILLRQEVAQRHFGDENPVGKVLVWGNGRSSVITGVFSIPETGSHLQFNALSPLSSVVMEGRRFDSWEGGYVTSYVLLKPYADPEDVTNKIAGILDSHLGRKTSSEFNLVPLKDLHLRTQHIRVSWNAGQGNILYTLSLGAIGMFLVLIACINYTNLASARSVPRSMEIGLRKVIGAKKRDLQFQFISESVFVALIAAVLAVALVEVSKPWLSSVAGRPLHFGLGGGGTFLSILALTVLVGILSGLYPAVVLSSFKPSDVLRRSVHGVIKGMWFRRGLVVFQFFLSVFLIISVGVIHKQINFMRSKDLGFNPDQVIYVQISGIPSAYEHRLAMRDKFSELKGVEAAGLSGSLPGLTYARSNIVPEGQSEDWAMDMVIVDERCLDVYQFRLVQGRFFSKDFPSDRSWDQGSGAFVLNQTAVKRLGWDNPLGKTITAGDLGAVGTVIGVVEDFHNQSLHEPIEPILLADLGWDAFINMRLSADGISEILAGLEKTWAEFVPDEPFQFSFIDDEFERLYQNEKRIGALAKIFSVLALGIAVLGVLGLTSFTTERRAKEIGIRRVLGASVKNLVYLFSKEFVICVLVGNLIAWPIAFILAGHWLRNFAYRTDPGLFVFAISFVFTMAVALVTVGLLVFRAAGANPAVSLRDE
jgi:putative ABC transport system permease protein